MIEVVDAVWTDVGLVLDCEKTTNKTLLLGLLSEMDCNLDSKL